MRTLTVYSRRGCHLCEQLIEEVLPLVRGRAEVEVRDIDSREDWRREYGFRIPVVETGGRLVCEFTLDRAALEKALGQGAA